MHRKFLIRSRKLWLAGGFVLCACLSPSVQSQTESVDTTVYTSAPVTIISGRTSSESRLTTTPLSVLNDSDITHLNTRQVAELLRLLPGVFVRDYGGLGGIKTVSLRGATAAQTAVYLDGIKLNASQNGLFDFSSLPSSMISSIVVHDGTDPASSNSNAIGEVVSMDSRSRIDTAFSLNATLGYGSWNERYISAQYSQQLSKKSSLIASFDYAASDGNYSFEFNNFGVTSSFDRTNDDSRSLSGGLLFLCEESSYKSSTRVLLRSSRRGAPGEVIQGQVNGTTARLNDDDALVIERLTLPLKSNSLLQVSLFGKYNEQEYKDSSTSLLGVPIDDHYRSRDAGLSGEYRIDYSDIHSLTICADLYDSDLHGNLLRFNAGNHARRLNAGLGAGYTLNKLTVTDKLSAAIISGLRFDSFSDANPFWSPRLGVLLHCGDNIEMKINYSYAFRPPSFNELYFQNYGTTTLRPERSHSLKAGVDIETPKLLFFDDVAIGVNAFILSVQDQIIATPRSAVAWSAQNIAKVQSEGIEFSVKASLANTTSLRLGYSFQDVRDKRENYFTFDKVVPFSPQHLLFATLNTTLGAFTFGQTAQYTGSRYTQPDNTAESKLNAFLTINLSASYKFSIETLSLSARVDIDNVLDKSYVIVPNYPMPGRGLRGTVGIGL